MRILISLLVQNPQWVEHVPDIHLWENLDEPGVALFSQLVEVCRENIGIRTGQLIEFWRNTPHFKALEILAMWNHLENKENPESTFKEFKDMLRFFFAQLVEKRIEVLIAKDRTESLTQDEKYELATLLTQRAS